jgi:hypothetical protein
LKNKKIGSRPGSPGFGRAVAIAGLLLNPDWFSYRVDPSGWAGFNNIDKNTNKKERKKENLIEDINLCINERGVESALEKERRKRKKAT